MSAYTRRRILGGLGAVAAPLALGANARDLLAAGTPASAWGAQRPRRLVGSPDPAIEYHGFDSVEMELAYGGEEARRRILGPSAGRVPVRPGFDWAGTAAALRSRFPDLERHFIFEYYPWYDDAPYRHWTQWDRVPPDDIAATSYPALGPYGSRDTAVIEQHARWIREVGAGAVNISWWGQGSFTDGSVHAVMDVMADHDIKVMFHLEPYANDRAFDYTDDIQYLLREYGDRRGWDAMLVLRDEDGSEGPVFKKIGRAHV